MHYKTIHNVNDGFDGHTAAACREYTVPREDPKSQIKTCIGCFTKFGPVLQVKTTCCLDINGIEIPILSTTGDGSNPWVVYPKATTATWKSYITMIQISLQDAMSC